MALLHNDPELRPLRTILRKNLTPAEAALWNRLKGSKLEGRKFRRQFGVGKYVVTFYCPAERLGVELDRAGDSIGAALQDDHKRRRFLDALEIKVIRFDDKLVFETPELVIEQIKANFAWRQCSRLDGV